MVEDASALLVSHAEERSAAIFRTLNKKRLGPSDLDGFRVAYDVAARLQLISIYLRSLPPYWIESDVEQLCRTVLRDLQAITLLTQGSTGSAFLPSLPKFTSLFGLNESTNAEKSIVTFFREKRKDAQSLKGACDDLLSKLTQGEDDAEELPNSAIQHLDALHTSADFNNDFFRALQLTAECNPQLHNASCTAAAIGRDSQALWHPARLCLHETENNQGLISPFVKVLVPAMDLTVWQEFCLMIQGQTEKPLEYSQQLLTRGGFCPLLEREITARLFLSFRHGHGLFLLKKSQVLNQLLQAGHGETLAAVIRNYDLTPRDKVVLSYAIARSFWQYYDSELMQTKWTSDTIWFMPEESSRKHQGKLQLCAYLSFPFGAPDNTTPDVVQDDLLTHRCPRIFDIGVLLLEIGLAKPFRTGRRRDRVAQANLSHKIATDEMLELEKMNWDGFANSKKYFDSAVRYCLNDTNFIPPSKQPKSLQQGGVLPTRPAMAADSQADVLKRRKILYKNVVRPLAWLAKRGFGAQAGDIPYVKKKPSSSSSHNASSNTSWQAEPGALFHSAIVPKMWLSDLMKISRQVESKRREWRVTSPVRVAILDTGLDMDLPVFTKKSGLFKSVTDMKDFILPGTMTMTDTFGHGTFMARLVMECAPGAEILVARVAENTHELKNRQASIKEAILWAGQTGKADIIFMAFGFPNNDPGIREAIETVQKQRKEDIIFLASAGNSSTDDESFPARHPSVISVYATNCHGAFLQSNSASTTLGAAVLGTYGDDIPDSLREEFRTTYPKVCEPGSSVATAVMAGISATMLAYASVLPSLVPLQGVAASTSHPVLRRLWTTKGMEAMLYRLAQEDQDRPRLKAVKPMWFWKSRPNDTARYCAVFDTLSDIDRRFPRPTETG